MKKDVASILKALQTGTFDLEGQFIYGSNSTFMVNCRYEGETFKAVYKPTRGERPLWDFPSQTLARREVAAYLISEALGWSLVPPTVYRLEESPMGPGSAQLFIEHDPDHHYFNYSEQERRQIPIVMLFDLLINNADRKAGHLLIDPENKLWLIDHGLCFHIEDKLRTVIWDNAGEPIPPTLLSDLARLASQLDQDENLRAALASHLLGEEIQALQYRCKDLLVREAFPFPPEDRRAYPWPLV
jgi:uncharacterized repeat protein (TIGR03843 family)